MPPKKVSQKAEGSRQQDKKEKQTKLFSKDTVQEPGNEPLKATKSRSKQFTEQCLGDKKGLEQNHTSMWDYGSGETGQKLLISSWNVNGVRAVLGRSDLQKYVERVQPDILCIGETKIDHTVFTKSPIQLEGYHGYWNFCKCSAGYSGVAIFSKHLPIAVTQDLPQKQHSQEGRTLTIEFEQFFLVTSYVPNSGQKLDRLKYRVEEWDKCFQNYVNELKLKKAVVICGDLNVVHQEIDIARPKGNEKTAGFTKEERESFTKMLASGWVDTFRELYPKSVKYSWWSVRTGGRAKGIGWRLDYFLVDSKSIGLVKDSLINNEVFGSDHCPIELQLQLK